MPKGYKESVDASSGDEINLRFVGSDEDDDLKDMEYPLEHHEPSVDTHPPETKADAERVAAETAAAEKTAKAEAEKAKEEEEEEEEEEEAKKADEEEEEEAKKADEEEEEVKKTEEEEEEEEAKTQGIPHKRFEEVNKKKKAAEEENLKLKAELEALKEAEESAQKAKEEAAAFDFDEAETQYMKLLLDGETEQALDKRKEIRTAEASIYQADAAKTAHQASTESAASAAFQSAASALEAEYPALDNASEDFREDLREEVIDLYAGWVNSDTHDPVTALRKASETVMKLNGIAKIGEAEEEEAPRSKQKASKSEGKSKVKAAKQQPAKTDDANNSPDKPGSGVDIMAMSDEEWESLPESKRRELRGDFSN